MCVEMLLKWKVGPAKKKEMCPDVYVSICVLLVLPTPLLLNHPLLLEIKTSFSFLSHVQVPVTCSMESKYSARSVSPTRPALIFKPIDT